jgi:hypothetical protein
MSAAVFHGMSTFRSTQIDVGIPLKTKIANLPQWPTIGVFYFDTVRYETGIQTVDESGEIIESSCDIYRNLFSNENHRFHRHQ